MVRVNISIEEEKLKEIDAIRKEKGLSRSRFLKEAAGLYIENYRRELAKEKRKEKIKEAIKIQDKLRNNSKGWNGISEIRKWRESR